MSKKKKVQKTNAMRIIEQYQVPYKEYSFEWREDHLGTAYVADKLGLKESTIFKTLVTIGHQTGPVVAVIPGEKELDLKKLARVSGNKKIEMLPLKDLEETTGYIRGGCSPIGMKKSFPTYLAQEAQELDWLIISAGKRGMQIELSPAALLEITKGNLAELTN